MYNHRIINAIEKAVETSIQTFFPLSELPRNPIANKNVIKKDETTYITAWFADGYCYGNYDLDLAVKIKDDMCEELENSLRTRNLKTVVTGTVVQEFDWNHQHYDLNNHGVNWLSILEIKILDKIGNIYKNQDDYGGEVVDDALATLH